MFLSPADEFEVYPLWLCPMKVLDRGPYFLRPARGAEQMYTAPSLHQITRKCEQSLRLVDCLWMCRYVDIGAYGNPERWPKPPNPSPAVASVRTSQRTSPCPTSFPPAEGLHGFECPS